MPRFGAPGQGFIKRGVDVAIAPVFAGLKGLYDGMLCCVIVLCCVCVRRRVAAAYMTALFAEPQMYPAAADLETVFAAVRARSHFGDRTDVFAVFH